MLDQMVPPDELNFVGCGSFRKIGDEFLQHFVTVGGLQPDHRVLDVGCGIGRMAIPLTQYLSPRGSYEGFDIVDFGIEWCRSRITSQYPNFRFQVADICNRTYHPAGRYQAAVYEFPYPAGSFDFVFLTSVFTHMMPAEFENYLAEIARVLKPGGRVFSTFFLYTPESARLMREGKAMIPFVRQGGYWVKNRQIPEDAICFRETYVARQYARVGLRIDAPVHYGVWSGRAGGLTSHDVIVATKTGSASPAHTAIHASKRFIHHLSSRLTRKLLGSRPGPVDIAIVRAREHLAKHPDLLRRAGG